jgi:D-alanine-D-alanine ligase
MIDVDQDWWMKIFDETYLITDARSVCDDTLTRREVDFLEQTLNLEKSSPILDLCGGQGRHSLELSRRGFQNVTVLDFSEVLVRLGEVSARKEGLNTLFIKNDARCTDLPDERFEIIIVMASSFGYFVEESENEKILCEAHRILRPMGTLLLDLPNRAFVIQNFKSQSWHEANEDIVVCRQRRLDDEILYCREMVVSKQKGLVRDGNYCVRLYTQEKVTAMLSSAGFGDVTTQENFSSHDGNGDYGCMTNRMIVTARRSEVSQKSMEHGARGTGQGV